MDIKDFFNSGNQFWTEGWGRYPNQFLKAWAPVVAGPRVKTWVGPLGMMARCWNACRGNVDPWAVSAEKGMLDAYAVASSLDVVYSLHRLIKLCEGVAHSGQLLNFPYKVGRVVLDAQPLIQKVVPHVPQIRCISWSGAPLPPWVGVVTSLFGLAYQGYRYWHSARRAGEKYNGLSRTPDVLNKKETSIRRSALRAGLLELCRLSVVLLSCRNGGGSKVAVASKVGGAAVVCLESYGSFQRLRKV